MQTVSFITVTADGRQLGGGQQHMTGVPTTDNGSWAANAEQIRRHMQNTGRLGPTDRVVITHVTADQ